MHVMLSLMWVLIAASLSKKNNFTVARKCFLMLSSSSLEVFLQIEAQIKKGLMVNSLTLLISARPKT